MCIRDRLRSENEKLPGLERDLRLTLALLEKNRDLALRWVQKKHERHRLERSAKKVISMWAHHVDTRHWAEVDPVSGKRTPSRSERRRKERQDAILRKRALEQERKEAMLEEMRKQNPHAAL